jgi:bifunctional non-homologous end joining protein LigD
LRGRELPCVAAPRTWPELDRPEKLRQLRFEEVLERAIDGNRHEDPLAALFTDKKPAVPA